MKLTAIPVLCDFIRFMQFSDEPALQECMVAQMVHNDRNIKVQINEQQHPQMKKLNVITVKSRLNSKVAQFTI